MWNVQKLIEPNISMYYNGGGERGAAELWMDVSIYLYAVATVYIKARFCGFCIFCGL